MAIVLRADGSQEEREGPLTLAQLQELVEGDIEILRLGRGEVLIVNENGRNIDLPLNKVATVLFRGVPARHRGFIVGTAVLARIKYPGTARERVE